MLKDAYGRQIRYLRVSVTDRCNLRCLYCSQKAFEWLPPEDILSYEEIYEVVSAAVELGVERVRLTGGEPLIRKGLPELIRRLAAIPGLKDLSLTTNGLRLKELASELKAAGLKRVNVSLDTLRPERFRELTGLDGLSKVLAGIDAALSVGLSPVKINMVVLRGFNEDEIEEMAKLTFEKPVHVRFIEFMPVGEGAGWNEERWMPLFEIRKRVESVGSLYPTVSEGGGPAKSFRFAGAKGAVGFIAAMSEHFCARCNRLRLTPEGKLRFCLFSDREFDLKPYLSQGREVLKKILVESVKEKPASRLEGHLPRRLMRSIGG
ncbi:GTP 3',8-cyclase MoaA [Thermosulfurimonas dismutans]|uniref:GTP 3',8-cyclase n=1 Tax=Thermosulfurimonas dismutans TaxID=999894 RepID=A0A179D301_9BACT|nr:GTP 3',8-cyclase MoaA [Thermosulfurimonas dismutans]OAQ20008.1 Molybdenum cofactor biosynthesis protein MoaA [Thermosulfurimonas dismutans]